MAHSIEYKKKRALQALEKMTDLLVDLHEVVNPEFLVGFKYMIKACKRNIDGTPLDSIMYIRKLGDKLG